MALFFLLRQLDVPFSCLHFVHGDSDFQRTARDFCWDLCSRFQVALRVEPIEVRKDREVSWEAAARQLRYAQVESLDGLFLTAHTADDQAETLVMRLLDGSGLAGLAGVRRQRGSVVRPLLHFRRAELREFLLGLGESWLEDPTNLDGNDRARLRAEVMPLLEAIRPRLVEALGRTAADLASDEDALRTEAFGFCQRHTLEGDHWRLSELRGLHSSVRLRFLRQLWRRTAPQKRPLGGVLREAQHLIERGGDDRAVRFGSVCLRALGPHLWCEPLGLSPLEEVVLPSEITQPLMGPGWAVYPPDFAVRSQGVSLALPGKVLASGVACSVRARRPGDRYRGKELKKLLAGLGHPPWVRDRWPLVTLEQKIVAVPGLEGGAIAGQAFMLVDPYRWRWPFEK